MERHVASPHVVRPKRGRWCTLVVVVLCGLLCGPALGSGWVEFANETAMRIDPSLDAAMFVTDVEEKDYAWGDLDRDGDTDLVIVRKNPFSDSIGKPNLLLMNQNGLLVDRTADFAVDATDGGQGFNDLTADRDVVLVDIDDDGWLDVVIAPAGAYDPLLPKTISHPRVYMNLQGDPWNGLRYEEPRIPLITPTPNFCALDAGDVTGDGLPDLYFSDYHNDLENRLLINDGTGHFIDETVARTLPSFNEGVFGTHNVIADMDNDGRNDLIIDHALGPYAVRIAFNPVGNEGFFGTVTEAYTGSPYFFEVGDLNSDGLLDLVVVDDGTDIYMLNQGGGNLFQCGSCAFQNSGGFGGNALIADLNNDGWNDVMVTDVDVDVPGCGGVMDIHRNNADPPNVTFTYDIANIPLSLLGGAHDVAALDIDGDHWLDLVIGRCTGTEIWINQPPVNLSFAYPDGLPQQATPDRSTTFRVAVSPGSGTTPQPATGKQYVSIDGGPFVEAVMTEESPNVYFVDLPAVPCTTVVRFYVSAETTGGEAIFNPTDAPNVSNKLLSSLGTVVVLDERFEVDNPAWTVTNDALLLDGAWERVDPNFTLFGTNLAQPDVDFGNSAGETMCFITEQDFNAVAEDDDVDGGPTTLTSPVVDLDGTDAIVSYARWHFCSDHLDGNTSEQDALLTQVSNGGPWITVEETFWTNGGWEARSFKVGDHVTPTATVQVRFVSVDQPNNSLTESGIDSVVVTRFECSGSCIADSACADALFCNGVETCVANQCVAGVDPCASTGQLCDEAVDQCFECFSDQDCDDHLFCTGVETCSAGVCVGGSDPCQLGQICDDIDDICTLCGSDLDCDFCGGEQCLAGKCLPANNAVQNGLFDGPAGWTDNIPSDGSITYAGNLTVVGPDTEIAAFIWASQANVDLGGDDLEFDLVDYSTSMDKFDFDRPVFYLDGTFYGLDDDGTLGSVIPTAGNGAYGNIDNANQVSDIHFAIDVESLAGAGPHTIGFGVMTADGIFGPGIAVFDNAFSGAAIDPCPGQACDPGLGCVDCVSNTDCDDGVFCNGAEMCDPEAGCQAGTMPCADRETCDEATDTCLGPPIVLQPRMGDPVDGLTVAQLARFFDGKAEFERLFEEAEGLGPAFNKDSCAGCHNTPVGGSGTILVTRFGFTDKGSFDSLESLGGSLLQEQAIHPDCAEHVHGNTQAQRLTNSTLGAGLVEAIADADILVRADVPPPGLSGRAHMVSALEDGKGAPLRVGRFGWKAQLPTVLSFSADAANNEIGITNRLLVDEQDPNGMDPPSLGRPDDCDTVPDPEDDAPAGSAFIDKVTDFQRFLAPPPQAPRSGMTGEVLFTSVGCADCHVPAFTTGAAAEAALTSIPLKPYSDFLLHNMGQLGDQIAQGAAEPLEMRTPSLWGLRVRDPLLHDGRVIGGTFTERIRGADGLGGVVGWHNVVGSEAADSGAAFQALSGTEQDALISFLDSLGRREFDLNDDGDQIGDGSVDLDDFNIFRTVCYLQGPFTADDRCAVADVDQDGDVDLNDFSLFLEAYDEPLPDCNDNGSPDLQDILVGLTADDDQDGEPDICGIVIRIPSFTDETLLRMHTRPDVGAGDTADKDYGIADFDLDGDLDIIVARRIGLPGFNNDDPLPNTLLMNGDGTLSDLTAELAPSLLVSKRSRDVLTADFNNDGLMDALIGDGTDIVPDLLINQGFDNRGAWLGLLSHVGLPTGFNVDVWTLAVGDVVGDDDGYPDVYVGVRLGNDRLLINLGAPEGTWLGFADESARLGANAVTSATRSSRIIDINGDGDQDIIGGVTFPEGEVRLLSNSGGGFFTTSPQVLFDDFAYNFNLGDLNGDGNLDFFGVRNAFDQYRENLGPGSGDDLLLSPALTAENSNGFGANVIVGDLNTDGTDDFLVVDLDQELPDDCSRRLKIFVNAGVAPYLTDAYPVPQLWTPNGTSDVALIDFDGDDDLDMLIGHCNGQSIFMQDGGIAACNWPQCADNDSNGIRDDNCVWWDCVNNACVGTDIVFADMGGQFGACAPDGSADNNDRNHALNCFANTSIDGTPGYPCEDDSYFSPTAFRVDAGGSFGACAPDGVCDGNDAFAALNAFGDSTTCSCPLDGAPAPQMSGPPAIIDQAHITLVVERARSVTPGDQVVVDVMLNTPLADLRGYQLHLGVRGGYRGTLRLVDIHVDQRRDQVMDDIGHWQATNVATSQVLLGVDGPGKPRSAGYLASFIYEATPDAAGRFIVELLRADRDPAQRTFLFPTAAGERIAIRSTPAIVDIGMAQ